MSTNQTKFKVGNKMGKGRILGSKNNPDLSSLRILLQEGFSENRPWIKECLMQMLKDYRVHLNELNKRITELKPEEKEYTATLKFLCYTRSALLEEFKWLLQLKCNLEPKELKADVNISYTAEDLLGRFDEAVHPSGN